MRELPSLDRLLADLGGNTFEVLALSIDRQNLEVVSPFFERLGDQRADQKQTKWRTGPGSMAKHAIFRLDGSQQGKYTRA